MKIKVMLFATLKDLVGQNRFMLEAGEGQVTVDDVRRILATQHPQLEANLQAAIAAVNQEYAFGGDIVYEGDEVAFFPPVSGGQYPEIFQLAEDAVDHDALIEAITTPGTGAVCLFSGFVRGDTQKEGHLPLTEYLEYEAYTPMALAKMQQVAQEIRERYPLVQGIAIVQRVGKLAVGQNTVLIACASGHRDQGCFEAARYGIDRLKEIVPVWKKEVGKAGEVWIEGEYIPTPDDRNG